MLQLFYTKRIFRWFRYSVHLAIFQKKLVVACQILREKKHLYTWEEKWCIYTIVLKLDPSTLLWFPSCLGIHFHNSTPIASKDGPMPSWWFPIPLNHKLQPSTHYWLCFFIYLTFTCNLVLTMFFVVSDIISDFLILIYKNTESFTAMHISWDVNITAYMSISSQKALLQCIFLEMSILQLTCLYHQDIDFPQGQVNKTTCS